MTEIRLAPIIAAMNMGNRKMLALRTPAHPNRWGTEGTSHLDAAYELAIGGVLEHAKAAWPRYKFYDPGDPNSTDPTRIRHKLAEAVTKAHNEERFR